jgi:hypothetical protein
LILRTPYRTLSRSLYGDSGDVSLVIGIVPKHLSDLKSHEAAAGDSQGFFERLLGLRAPVKDPAAVIGEFENACIPESFIDSNDVESEMRSTIVVMSGSSLPSLPSHSM